MSVESINRELRQQEPLGTTARACSQCARGRSTPYLCTHRRNKTEGRVFLCRECVHRPNSSVHLRWHILGPDVADAPTPKDPTVT
jgi:hypothetical protein